MNKTEQYLRKILAIRLGKWTEEQVWCGHCKPEDLEIKGDKLHYKNKILIRQSKIN